MTSLLAIVVLVSMLLTGCSQQPTALPYTDTSNTLYLHAYSQNGSLVSERWRTITTRQGGDGANTLGYNLGAALGAIHMRQNLLKNVVEDVTKGPK